MSREKTGARRQRFHEFVERNRKSNGYLLRKTVFNVGYKIVRMILLFGLCFLILQPLFNKISISFMMEKDLYDSTIVSVPRNFTRANYALASQLMDYWNVLRNTAIIALIVSVIQVAACTLVGYGFARYKFPFKNFWFLCVILVIIVPPQTVMSSLYLNFGNFDILGIFKALTGKRLNLLNSISPYLLLCFGCMGLKSGLYIFLIRQFFRGVPKELEEAAYVDGCGKFATFTRIMLPDAKPILTSCFLFAYVWQWTDSFYSNMFLRKYALLPKALTTLGGGQLDRYLQTQQVGSKATIAYTQAMTATGTLMAIIPLLIIYIVAQKGFVESLSQTGIKM